MKAVVFYGALQPGLQFRDFRNERYLTLSFFGGDVQGGKGRKDVQKKGRHCCPSGDGFFLTIILFLEFESIWPVDIH